MLKEALINLARYPRRSRCSILLAAVLLAVTKYSAEAQMQFNTLHSFNRADGFGPMAGVVADAGGVLYGTTSQGGSDGLGTVFKVDPKTLAMTTLHAFAGGDGAFVYSGLTLGTDGLLYGSTYAGGTADLGTLFSLTPDGQMFDSLHSFDIGGGAKPDDLQLSETGNGTFLGVTSEGGLNGGGTLFELNPVNGTTETLCDFAATGGAGVDAGLVHGRDGKWYGTTYSGGANGLGTVFQFDPGTRTLTVLHDFVGPDGANPVPGALMQGSDGMLYGTTQQGGGSYGTVYRIDPSTTAFKVLHAFSGVNDGRNPLGGVTEGGDGYLYGTTALGGAGYGIIYRVNPATLAYGIVVWFSGGNGRQPSGNLIRGSDNALYGTTRLGGAYNCGSVYRLLIDTTSPVIASITATPNAVSGSGKMVSVSLTVNASDNLDPAPRSKIIGVSCNQAATGDWVITGDLTVSLRVKSTGRSSRIYTITVECTDASGNSSTGTVDVPVSK